MGLSINVFVFGFVIDIMFLKVVNGCVYDGWSGEDIDYFFLIMGFVVYWEEVIDFESNIMNSCYCFGIKFGGC